MKKIIATMMAVFLVCLVTACEGGPEETKVHGSTRPNPLAGH